MIKSQYFLLSFSILFVALKLVAISTTSLNLYGDEAQYWLWSKNLAFGYYSKPPLLPWLIRVFGLIAGDTFFAIKLMELHNPILSFEYVKIKLNTILTIFYK